MALLLLSGCDFDVFGSSTKDIIGSYELKQWEDFKTYYLYGPQDTGWGAIDGTVDRIGWNIRYILVLQNDDGNGSGWRIIDSKTDIVSPLLTYPDVKANPNVSNINVQSAVVAWNSL